MALQTLSEEKFTTISNLFQSRSARESYIRSTLDILIPAQIRALRLREEWTQTQLAQQAGMKQARISAIETPGLVNFSLETLVRLAAAYKVGLQVRFIPHSVMLDWENHFNQDVFDVVRLPQDQAFIYGAPQGEYGQEPSENLLRALDPTRPVRPQQETAPQKEIKQNGENDAIDIGAARKSLRLLNPRGNDDGNRNISPTPSSLSGGKMPISKEPEYATGV